MLIIHPENWDRYSQGALWDNLSLGLEMLI